MAFQFEAERLWEITPRNADRFMALFISRKSVQELVEALLQDPTIRKFVDDPSMGFQEKFNGKRRLYIRTGNAITCTNRVGEKRTPNAEVVAILLKHSLTKFIVDIEEMMDGNNGNRGIVMLDSLLLGEDGMGGDEYEYREACLHREFDGFHPLVHVVQTARTREAKVKLLVRLLSENAEGMVIRRMKAPYKCGEAKQHFKLKFWKTVDAVVIARAVEKGRVKESVRIGVYWNGKLKDICGVSLIGRERVEPGDVIEVKCLYSTPGRDIVQPIMLRKRDDKRPELCTMDQLDKILNKNWMVAKED